LKPFNNTLYFLFLLQNLLKLNGLKTNNPLFLTATTLGTRTCKRTQPPTITPCWAQLSRCLGIEFPTQPSGDSEWKPPADERKCGIDFMVCFRCVLTASHLQVAMVGHPFPLSTPLRKPRGDCLAFSSRTPLSRQHFLRFVLSFAYLSLHWKRKINFSHMIFVILHE